MYAISDKAPGPEPLIAFFQEGPAASFGDNTPNGPKAIVVSPPNLTVTIPSICMIHLPSLRLTISPNSLIVSESDSKL